MFEKFTENALKVIMVAQQETRSLNHNFCGTEQILLGLFAEGTKSAQILNSVGLKLEDARTEVEKIIGKGSGSELEIPFTPQAKKLLENAYSKANSLNIPIMDIVLLWVLTETDGVHLQVLKNLNIDVDKIKTLIVKKENLDLTLGTLSFILLTSILICFAGILIYDLVTSLKLTTTGIIAILELIMLNIVLIKYFNLPYNPFPFLRLIYLSLAILFIIILISSLGIWGMITIGKYKYIG